MNWRFAYRIGFHPWEDAAKEPAFVAKATELFEREERGQEPPYGPALDLGTGSGIWGIELAKRGWQVTGVDIVDKALARARRRAEQAGVAMQVIKADVTALTKAGLNSGYRLVLDTGTFHDLTDDQRLAMGREVSVVATPDATVLLLVWPRRRRPLIRGADRSDIEAAFPEWTITDVTPSHFRLPAPVQLILRPDEHWYRLRRERRARAV
jgi:cyclopropane fatty-acyl-phospholipid synthase-like methyltransferase